MGTSNGKGTIRAAFEQWPQWVRLIQNRYKLAGTGGYTLIELVVVLVIIGLIATIAVRSLSTVNETVRIEQTRDRLIRLGHAICGDPSLVSGGVRTDYGFVGDVGSLPPTLGALVQNTGGWSTWRGPYVSDELTMVGSSSTYDRDAWGAPIQLNVQPSAVALASSGGSVGLTRRLANSSNDLLRNRVSVLVMDLNYTPPGTDFTDSVTLLLRYPNGTGGYVTKATNPLPNGYGIFDSIPTGIHDLRLVYEPASDTLVRRVNVDPGQDSYVEMQYYDDVWFVDTTGGGGGGATPTSLTLVTGSVVPGQHSQCDRVYFRVTNQGSTSASIGSVTFTWSSPTAFYQQLRWGGTSIHNSNNPRTGSGTEIVFGSPVSVAPGDTVAIELRGFSSTISGGGSSVDMDHTTLTAAFSDGSTFALTTGGCL